MVKIVVFTYLNSNLSLVLQLKLSSVYFIFVCPDTCIQLAPSPRVRRLPMSRNSKVDVNLLHVLLALLQLWTCIYNELSFCFLSAGKSSEGISNGGDFGDGD